MVADMLTRIRNANLVNHRIVYIKKSQMNIAIAQILKEEGYISDFKNVDKDSYKKSLLLYLKYHGQKREPIITGLKRISKPGLRIYVNKRNLPKVLNNLGISILSTSKGIVTGTTASKIGVGGEVLCYIW